VFGVRPVTVADCRVPGTAGVGVPVHRVALLKFAAVMGEVE
jgi:hypothetical protein